MIHNQLLDIAHSPQYLSPVLGNLGISRDIILNYEKFANYVVYSLFISEKVKWPNLLAKSGYTLIYILIHNILKVKKTS